MSEFLESVRWTACVHRLDLGLFSHPQEFSGNGVRNHVKSRGKNPLYGKKKFLGGVSNPGRSIKQGSEPNTLPTELFRPPSGVGSRVCRPRGGFLTTRPPRRADSSCTRTQVQLLCFVGWLLNVPPTCQCISRTDLLRQF